MIYFVSRKKEVLVLKKLKNVLTVGFALLILQGCFRNEQPPKDDSKEQEKTETVVEKDKSLPEVKTTDWDLLLVNGTHPLPENYEEQTEYQEVDGQLIDARIVENYLAMKTAAKEAGYDLYLGSAYRSVDHQKFNYDWNVNFYMEQGMTEAEAQAKTEELIAKPGYSEHHTGLALDIVDADWFATHESPYVEEYDTQPSQQWLVKHAPEYGFILRYPKNKMEETGIAYESWHFRYVGKESAQYITNHQLTLEAYLDFLEQ